MREILFRGKRTDTGAWVYGAFAPDALEPSHGDMVTWGFIRRFNADTEHMETIEVDRATVGQFTGLLDKNGKKIFEGDIVDCWSEGVNAKGTVQQRKDGLWIIYPAWQKHIMWGLCPDEYLNTTVEIVGNIHDNPELIGGDSNS